MTSPTPSRRARPTARSSAHSDSSSADDLPATAVKARSGAGKLGRVARVVATLSNSVAARRGDDGPPGIVEGEWLSHRAVEMGLGGQSPHLCRAQERLGRHASDEGAVTPDPSGRPVRLRPQQLTVEVGETRSTHQPIRPRARPRRNVSCANLPPEGDSPRPPVGNTWRRRQLAAKDRRWPTCPISG